MRNSSNKLGIPVIRVSFSEILIKGKEISFELAGEFELFKFELSRFHCNQEIKLIN